MANITIHAFQNAQFTKSVEKITSAAALNTLTASIDWGDNSTSFGGLQAVGTTATNETRYLVNGLHTYQTAGTFHIVITLSENNVPTGQPGTATAIVAKDNIILDGTLTGTYVFAAPQPPATGSTYQFEGKGNLQRLGHVTADGTVVLTPGDNGKGPMTFVVPTGTVSIQFTGPTYVANQPFPATIKYMVTGGTGAWVAARGHGTIATTLNGDGTFSFVFTALP